MRAPLRTCEYCRTSGRMERRMFLFDVFRAFLPLHNPIGFGPADFIELALAALLVLMALVWRPWIQPYALKLAEKTGWSMLLLALLPVVLRLALLAHHPVPSPDVYDEFGHLLEADTLQHFRLANPPHALPQFFETFFVLQEPAYSSIYPVGQGLALALGWAIFGLPWAGVVLSVAAFCALCYWMLRAWTTPGWALAGGLLAVIEFGPLSQWMNSYWGGAFAAAAGCLVFGALPRLRNGPRARDAVLLGVGLGMHLLTRPYESIFLFLGVVLFFIPMLRKRDELRKLARVAPEVVLVLIAPMAIMLFQNKAVTGSWTTLPETITSYLERLEYRVRYYRFFFLAPLYLALVVFLVTIREFRFLWVALTLLLFSLGVNFFPAFQLHYIAAVTCLFVLVSVTGLERLGGAAARLIVFLCVAHFLFWYDLHVFEDSEPSVAMRPYETWDAIN